VCSAGWRDRYSMPKEIYGTPFRENLAISPRAQNNTLAVHDYNALKTISETSPHPPSHSPPPVCSRFRPRSGRVVGREMSFRNFPRRDKKCGHGGRANESFARPPRKTWKIYERERETERDRGRRKRESARDRAEFG